MASKHHVPPRRDEAGFGRDKDLEEDRRAGRPAEADLDGSEEKAGRRPAIHVSPDPDLERGARPTK